MFVAIAIVCDAWVKSDGLSVRELGMMKRKRIVEKMMLRRVCRRG